MILYCNHVNNVKHFPSLFSKMAGFYQWKENNNNIELGISSHATRRDLL
jgi:hypothetical protein